MTTVSSWRVLAAAGVALCLGTAGSSLAQTKWTLPSGYPPANLHTENLVKFAEDVKTATGGKLEITLHPNGSLFPAQQIKRAVQTGSAQAGEVLLSIHENEDPVFGIDVVPFLATSYPEAKKLWEASKAVVEKKLASQGLVLLYAVPWPPQGIFSKKEINSAADMKGAKWRAYNVGTARIGEAVGAQAVTVQAADVAQALATGVINMLMTSGATGVDAKMWESLTHYYDTQAWIPKNVVFVSKDAMDALDPATRDALLKAAATAEERGWASSEASNKKILEELASRGMKVLPPSDTLKQDMQKVGDQLIADWLKRAGADGKSVMDAYRGS